MKLWSRSPEGSILIASRPSVKSIWTLCAPFVQAAADLGLVLAQQVVDELLARVAGDLVGGIHQAQGRGRDDRLLHRHVRVAHAPRRGSCPRTAGSGTGRAVSRGIRRVWPAANGILKPSGAVFGSPCTQ